MKLDFRIIAAACLVMTTAACHREAKPVLQEIGMGFAGNSINNCVFRASSVTSDGRYRVAAFYDADSTVNLAFQKKGEGEWKVSRTRYKGNIADAHNVISIALDGKGYLHMCWGMHDAKLNYCRSLCPYSAEMGEVEPMVGRDEDMVTYPAFFRTRDGGLMFFYRSGGSGKGNLVLNRYGLGDGWARMQDNLIDGEGERNGYPQYFVDAKDNIHLSWVWRETPDVATNHDMCYAYSSDYGKTWKRTDGSLYEVPINLATAEYACSIPQNSELMNQTSMMADADGHPYIATYWRDRDSDVPQYRLVWHDGSSWKTRTLGNLTLPFRLAGGGTKCVPISRPSMVRAADGTVYCFFRSDEFGSKVNAWKIQDLGDPACERMELTEFSVGSWEPTVDFEAMRRDGSVTVFVQKCGQSGGDRTVEMGEEPVYILDL